MDILKDEILKARIEDITEDILGIYEARSLLCRIKLCEGFECEVHLVITQNDDDFIYEEPDLYDIFTYKVTDDYKLAYDDAHLSKMN